MRLSHWTGILLVLGLASGAVAWATPPAACGTLTAGFTIVNVPNQPGGSDYNASPPATTVKMGIWYPSQAPASSYAYFTDTSGLVAKNGAITDCGSGVQFPLLIFSHGWSGCGIQSVFLTEELARRGYIVAAPDHQDHGCSVDGGPNQTLQEINSDFPLKSFIGNYSNWNDQSGNYRNVDIKTITDWLLANSPWKDRINLNEIGMSGHSFGGYTAFAKIGGWASWLDTRFKAGIMYSPFIQAFQAQTPSTVPNATVPQMFQGGVLDVGITPCVKGPQPSGPVCPNPGQPGAFQAVQFPKYFAELGGKDSSHFSFSNKICGGSSTAPTTVQACLSNVPNAQLIVNYSEDFLDHYLQGRPPQRLYTVGTNWDTYWRAGGVPAGSYLPGMAAAPSGLASLKGESLVSITDNPPGEAVMPQQLDGVTVTLTSSSGRLGGGVTYRASLYGISPTQINFVVPPETPTDTYTVTASLNGGAIASGPITVQSISPGLFATPSGTAAGWAQSDNGVVPIYTNAPVPLDVTQAPTYVVLWGTGFRLGLNLAASATVGGVSVPVLFIVASPQFQGIDQVAIGPLPASLAGSGQVSVQVTAGGQKSNTVGLVIQ